MWRNVKTVDIKQVSNNIYRSNRPETYEDISQIRKLGIHSIISLENNPLVVKVEKDLVRHFGISFQNFPMSEISSPTSEQLIRVVHLINTSLKPVLVHCRRGVDRTGYVIAAYRMLEEGWSYKRAIKECKDNGHRTWWYFWWKDSLKNLKTYRAVLIEKNIFQ
jgi:tyrosine-protein phosphatase SIW14